MPNGISFAPNLSLMGTTSNDDERADCFRRDGELALAVGGLVAISLAGCIFIVGQTTGSEARLLAESIRPNSRILCAAIIKAMATILALMLTMLGVAINSDRRMDEGFYRRVKTLALATMVVLVSAVCFLVLHCLPIEKSDAIPDWWFRAVYWFQLLACATIGGAVVSVVSLLFTTIRHVIHELGFRH